MVHPYNPSYLGGRVEEDNGSHDLISKKIHHTHTKKGLVERL
jgi:hypothetical protein